MHEHDGDGNTAVLVSDEEWQRAADFMKYEHNLAWEEETSENMIW